MDRENSDYDRTLNSIHEFFGRHAIPVQLPIGKEDQFSGVVDLIKRKAYIFEKNESGKFQETEIPDDMKDLAQKKIEELTEMVKGMLGPVMKEIL